MSKRGNRILGVVGDAFVIFAIFVIMTKLILPREDWMLYSIIWSAPMAFGRFLVHVTSDMKSSKRTIFLVILGMSAGALLLEILVIGIILKNPQWSKILVESVTAYVFGVILTKLIP